MTAMIEIENAEKTFIMHLQGGVELPVVRGVSFQVKAGECVVLSGPSGAGKSSILKMMFGNYRCDGGRIGIAAQSVGIHQRALELAVAYARERVQFGVPIIRHQAIRFRIAEMATELAAARLLTWRAAIAASAADAAGAADSAGGPGAAGDHRGGDRPVPVAPVAGRLAAEAKLFASEAANRACQESLQIHGGNGFHDDYEISRLYRDVRVTTIYEGTSEMQRLVIARHLLSKS